MNAADVAIIGAGPAGTTAAALIKRYEPSRRVVLFEQARFPRHQIGESTLPDMNALLHKLGVLERVREAGFLPKVGITYKSSGTPLQPIWAGRRAGHESSIATTSRRS